MRKRSYLEVMEDLNHPTIRVQSLHVLDRSRPNRGLARIAAALTYRDFRVLWTGAFTSSIGTWMQKVAQSWLVLTIAGPSSAFFLGLDSFMGEAPILLFTLIGGVVADEREEQDWRLPHEGVEPQEEGGRRAGNRQDQPALRHLLHPRPDAGREGAGPQHAEIAIGQC